MSWRSSLVHFVGGAFYEFCMGTLAFLFVHDPRVFPRVGCFYCLLVALYTPLLYFLVFSVVL